MNNWLSYPRNRKICHKSGYSIIVPENYNNNLMPLFCDVCQIRFSSKEDEKTFDLFKCCSACADTWAYSNKEAWLKGWRPDEDKIKISVEKRKFTNPVVVFE